MMRIILTLSLIVLILTSFIACGPSAPVARFQASDATGEIPIEVQFTDMSEGEIDSWEWDFNGDGEVDSTERNPVRSFDDPCNCTVSLTVKGPGGENSVNLPLQFIPVPVEADFSADPTEGQGKTTVEFTDLSTGELTSWAWDFYSDGVIDSTDQNPSYRYTKNGNHTVTLTISGPYGNDTMVKEDYISMTGCPT